MPLYLASDGILTNTADIIRLIIRDEAIHGYYIGYKFQKKMNGLSEDDREAVEEFAYDFMLNLHETEMAYTSDLYKDMDFFDDVIRFLNYNANKAMQNLGLARVFFHDDCTPSPAIMSALSPESDENHDFFSGAGSSYVMGTTTPHRRC